MTASRFTHAVRTALIAGALAAGLSACGSTNWGFPYRATIQQGNWITAEQVAQLQVGMSRDQVRFILGTPALQDVFHADRWDYPFYNKPGYGDDELRTFTVWFNNDLLDHWEGDEQPDRQPFQKADSGKEAIQDADDEAGSADDSAETTPDSATDAATQTDTDTGEDTTPAPGKEE
ncbi:MAG: outer membrane protein assembly factor BamE [Alcaligenaceae bacterium]|nr:outer membrane protein assembly factor BamE [Alcaligenaceae bacterium]